MVYLILLFSIALRSNNEIVSGLIFDPIKNEMFYAEKKNGAFLTIKELEFQKNNINNCFFATGGKIKNEPISLTGNQAQPLDLAYVAAGRYDGYFQNYLNLWDIAAGIILVKEAGGMLNKIDLSTNKKIKIIASSVDINSKFLQKLRNF